MKIAVSTAKQPSLTLMEKARVLADQYHLPFFHRAKGGLEGLMDSESLDAVLVVESARLVLKGRDFSFFWHPSTAKIATGELESLRETALIRALGLKPDSHVLDCTLGLASDALRVAMALSDEGRVVGLEASEIIGLMTREGLKALAATELSQIPAHLNPPPAALVAASGRIEVIQTGHDSYLRSAPDQSFDAVYFDPMFDQPGLDAHAINAFRSFADHGELSEAMVKEAKRVSRGAVVIKERYGSACFERLGIETFYGDCHYGKVVYGVAK